MLVHQHSSSQNKATETVFVKSVLLTFLHCGKVCCLATMGWIRRCFHKWKLQLNSARRINPFCLTVAPEASQTPSKPRAETLEQCLCQEEAFSGAAVGEEIMPKFTWAHKCFRILLYARVYLLLEGARASLFYADYLVSWITYLSIHL